MAVLRVYWEDLEKEASGNYWKEQLLKVYLEPNVMKLNFNTRKIECEKYESNQRELY